MIGRTLRPWGVRINGEWYWDEALYGMRGMVYCGEPAGNGVDVYDRGGCRICMATLQKLEG
ncbi:hypothetical protein [Desulfobacula phenolica]|uniref:Uncharacterized protein n=1 Tax=Desulfobacula phenolica TaxID=90732 RepID=A0A1H2H684_9BACT|nr:hypothetical protein [Desulfobacula phenolica]SDU27334.1 hypothetical protein SAMN04487931_10667 [Desulfobacula phenolica]